MKFSNRGDKSLQSKRMVQARTILGDNWELLVSNRTPDQQDPQWLGRIFVERMTNMGIRRVLIYGNNPLSRWLFRFESECDLQFLAVSDGWSATPDDLCAVAVTSMELETGARHVDECRKYLPHAALLTINEEVRAAADKLRYDTMIARANTLFQLLSDSARPTVVFVADNVFFNQLRMSQALRERGWNTVSVCLHHAKGNHQQGNFDAVFQIDLDCFLPVLSELSGLVLHTQGWLNAYHVPVLIDAFRSDEVCHITEMMDVQSFFFPQECEKTMEPFMRKCWGDTILVHNEMQKRCEQYLAKFCDGIVVCGGVIHQQILDPDERHSKKFLNFPCYCSRNYFAKPNMVEPPGEHEPWRLVFAGGIPPFGEQHPHELFGDAQILSILQRLIAQGLSVSVFNNPKMVSAHRFDDVYVDYLHLSKREPLLDFQRGVLPHQLSERINGHHFGMMLYDFTGVLVGDLHYRAIIPSKFFQYLEAGLPVLVSDRFESVCDLVTEFGIGLIVADSQLDHLESVLVSCDYMALRENVLRAREKLCMGVQVERLEKLYRDGLAGKMGDMLELIN